MDLTSIRYGPELSVNPETLEFLEGDGKLEEWKVAEGVKDSTREEVFVFSSPRSELDGSALRIREISSYVAGHGSVVWHAAYILGQYLLHRPELVAGKRVLELGAGCGLAGLAAAGAGGGGGGGVVLLTDFKQELLDNLAFNIELNAGQFAGEVRVAALDWAEPGPLAAAEGPFQVLLGADVVYAPKSGHLLARAIRALLAPGGIFYGVSPEGRPGFLALAHHAAAQGLVLETRDLSAFIREVCLPAAARGAAAANAAAAADEGPEGSVPPPPPPSDFLRDLESCPGRGYYLFSLHLPEGSAVATEAENAGRKAAVVSVEVGAWEELAPAPRTMPNFQGLADLEARGERPLRDGPRPRLISKSGGEYEVVRNDDDEPNSRTESSVERMLSFDNEEEESKATPDQPNDEELKAHAMQEIQQLMAGCWEMESQENYGKYLQYVCKLPGFMMNRIANQTYKQTFAFDGNVITIAVSGAGRNSSTDFEVGAEPLQCDMNGRKFRDTIRWEEGDEIVLVIDRRSEDGKVEILITRHISSVNGKMHQETRCTGKDGTNIHATQVFRKLTSPSS